MRLFQPLYIFSVCCAVAVPLHAQNDWGSVKALAPGTPISVVKRARQQCELIEVTDWELVCERDIGRARKIVFGRDDVRQVRLEYPDQGLTIAGILAGAAAGALIGFGALRNASDPEARGYGKAYGPPIGALAGGLIGRNLHRHGAVLYRKK